MTEKEQKAFNELDEYFHGPTYRCGIAWQTLKAAVLSPQANNSAMVPCLSWQDCRRNQFCPIGVQCGSKPCMIAQHQ